MNEFEEKDYSSARDTADSIKANADEIMQIFDSVDSYMNTLYGEAWQSQGADTASNRYQELRKNYEIFYNKVIAMNTHIHAITDANESADRAVSNIISDI